MNVVQGINCQLVVETLYAIDVQKETWLWTKIIKEISWESVRDGPEFEGQCVSKLLLNNKPFQCWRLKKSHLLYFLESKSTLMTCLFKFDLSLSLGSLANDHKLWWTIYFKNKGVQKFLWQMWPVILRILLYWDLNSIFSSLDYRIINEKSFLHAHFCTDWRS